MTGTSTGIDTARLGSYLSGELGVVVTDVEVIHDGLNLSLAISTEEDGRAYVLRRPNKLRHRDSFNDLEQEFGVMRRLQGTAIDAPEPVLFCEGAPVLDGSFLVMSHLDGESVPLGSDLPGRFRNAESRREVAHHLVDTLAELHSLDVDPFAEVCDRRPVREQVDDVVDQFEEASSVTGHEPPDFREVRDWLRRNVPSNSVTALVHGDYRPGNVLFAGTDRPEITGVLDWETAFLGDPLTELGYFLLRWRDEGDPTPSLDAIEARYSNEDVIHQLKERNERGLAPFTSDPGSPTRRELVGRYEDRTGIEFENERFYRAFSAFVLAAVWEDLHRHQVEAGAESDWEPHIDYMTTIARSIVRGEFQL